MSLSNTLSRVLAACFAVTSAAHSQAVATGVKTIGLSAFGGVARISTDYNSTDYGFTLGGDVTRHFRLLDPSLEVRYSRAGGDVVGESSTVGGLKIEKQFHSFHPYFDVLFGYGVITFAKPIIFPTGPYASDNSFLKVYGGGLDYDVTRNFAVKADYQAQSWTLGVGNTLSPSIFTVGVLYRIPFKPLPRSR